LGCSRQNATTEADTSAQSQAKPNSESKDEQAIASWNRFIQRVQKNAKLAVADYDRQNPSDRGSYTVGVRGDLRKSDSLTNPLEGELVIQEATAYKAIFTKRSYTYTFKFVPQGDSWVPVSGVSEMSEFKQNKNSDPVKKTLPEAGVQNVLKKFLK
jgi:hypothetical protein